MISKQTKEELISKEMAIVAAGQRGDFAAIEPLLADEFLEIGDSGQLYSKSEVLRAMKEVRILDCAFERFNALAIDEHCVILTYTTAARRSAQGREFSQRAYRSSTWVCRQGSWCMVFHQASPLPPVG